MGAEIFTSSSLDCTEVLTLSQENEGFRSQGLDQTMSAMPPQSGTISEERPRSARFRRIRNAYQFAALLFFNSFLTYLGLNLILGTLFFLRDALRPQTNPVSMTYGKSLDAVYPDFPEPERTAMLSEAWNRPYIYADFIHFQERPCTGKYVNVDQAGFRHSINQSPWPPAGENYNVFCFGGSTMFGYGVSDDQTIASHLQVQLAQALKRQVCVYNFGVGWHFSTQERLRFEQLLARDLIPDVALFLDGINESSQAAANRPAFSAQLAMAFEKSQGFGFQHPAGRSGIGNAMFDALFNRWPVGRLARGLTARAPAATPEIAAIDATIAQKSCAVYRWNRSLISAAAKARDVTAIFVVQPAPGFHLDNRKHLFANPVLCRNEAIYYQELEREVGSGKSQTNLIWSADLPLSEPGPLYVDTCHYTAKFSQSIARYIVTQSVAQKLLPVNDELP